MILILLLSVTFLFFVCLFHANEMSGGTAPRIITSLIIIMTGDVGIGLCALYGRLSAPEMLAAGILICGISLWLTAERRESLCRHNN